MSEEPHHIPACQQCRLRKVRCDHAAPKCSACVKSSSACIIVDPITKKQYTRDHIYDLECREKELKAKLDQATRLPRDAVAVVSPSRTHHDPSPINAHSVESTTTFSSYVGENSGLRLLGSVLINNEWANRKPRENEPRPQVPELSMRAHDFPPPAEAMALLENYFSRFHINHTFLVRKDVLEVYDNVYMSASRDDSSPQDRFRLFMIFAISGVTRYRAGISKEHPLGYYLAALALVQHIPLIGSPDAIQNSLLMARFGMYQHIGTSLWDISQFCMRQCVELGYHAPPRIAQAPLVEQKQRRIFWECYILDRYSSGILARPFAIADDDISVELPILADDDALKLADVASLSAISNIPPPFPTEVSVFVFYIRLRQISSRIHTEFFNGRRQHSHSTNSTPTPFTSAGYVQVMVQDFLSQLDVWRQSAPIFATPKSLYERPEFYDFLLEKDKLILVRGAMHVAPKLRNNAPPPQLLAQALLSATRVITLYSSMLETSYITWTRSYFQGIFTAGLSILFCINMSSNVDLGPSPDAMHPHSTLQLCSEVLHSFEKEMPDVRSFAIVFDELKDAVIRKAQPNAEDDTTHGHISVPASENLHGRSSNQDAPTAQAQIQSAATLNGFTATPMGTDLNATYFNPFSTESGDLDWPIMTEEFMENLEAGLGEYAWGFAGDDVYDWSLPDFS